LGPRECVPAGLPPPRVRPKIRWGLVAQNVGLRRPASPFRTRARTTRSQILSKGPKVVVDQQRRLTLGRKARASALRAAWLSFLSPSPASPSHREHTVAGGSRQRALRFRRARRPLLQAWPGFAPRHVDPDRRPRRACRLPPGVSFVRCRDGQVFSPATSEGRRTGQCSGHVPGPCTEPRALGRAPMPPPNVRAPSSSTVPRNWDEPGEQRPESASSRGRRRWGPISPHHSPPPNLAGRRHSRAWTASERGPTSR